MSKILFIGHEATRTGAPFVLLHLLRWLKANTNVGFQLLLLRGGELEPEFAEVSRVSVLASGKDNIIRKALRHYGIHRDGSHKHLSLLKKTLVGEGVGLIYSNTAVNGHVVASLAGAGRPVITHVHELEYALEHGIGVERTRLMKESTSHYIAVSECVRKNLVENHLIPEDKIDLIYEFIPVQVVDSDRKTAVRRKIRRELGIPGDDFIVGACGTIDWRKGSDLFVQLASLMRQHQVDRPVWFVWLGGALEGLVYYQLRHDIKLLGLENNVRFLGARADSLKYLCAFDVFVMTSREDPFPLVCLEAASVGVPIVCFDKAGGTRELVDGDSGYVVPYLDLAAMADKVSALLNSEELRLRCGRHAAQKTRRLYDVEIAAPKILKVIQRFTRTQ
jgi:glycosyltransferase involved in cell wall biosynthesis